MMKTRILALVLVICMIVAGMPVSVFANEDIATQSDYLELYTNDILVASETDTDTTKVEITTFTLTSTEMAGDGTEENPYQISTAEQLDAVRNNLSTYYILVNDIDLSAYANWAPIGSSGFPFTGVFDGRNNAIKNLTITRSTENYIGLFASNGGEIKNLSVESGSISGKDYVGAIAGYGSGKSIANCINNASVVGNERIGGIVGRTTWPVNNCENSGTITGYRYVGGISGSSTSNLSNCENNGVIYGYGAIGGITGEASGTIYNCENRGEIDGEGSIGGIVGSASGIITECTNRASVNGGNYIGGISGDFSGHTLNLAIQKCCNFGKITGENYVGGISGKHKGRSEMCYNVAKIFGKMYAGGLMGYAESGGQISNSYNLGDIVGEEDIGGIAGFSQHILSNCYNAGKVAGNIRVGGISGTTNNNAWKTTVGMYVTCLASCVTLSPHIEGTDEGKNGVIYGEMVDSSILIQPTNSLARTGIKGNAKKENSTTFLNVPEFYKQSTYEAIGWDFDEVWEIGAQSLPVLQWQNASNINRPKLSGYVDESRLQLAAGEWLKADKKYRETLEKQLQKELDSTGVSEDEKLLEKHGEDIELALPLDMPKKAQDACKIAYLRLFVASKAFQSVDLSSIKLKDEDDINEFGENVVNAVIKAFSSVNTSSYKYQNYEISFRGIGFGGASTGNVTCRDLTSQKTYSGLFTSSRDKTKEVLIDYIEQLKKLEIYAYEAACREAIKEIAGITPVSKLLSKKANNLLKSKFGDINEIVGFCRNVSSYAAGFTNAIVIASIKEDEMAEQLLEIISLTRDFDMDATMSDKIISSALKELEKAKNELHGIALAYAEGRDYETKKHTFLERIENFLLSMIKCPVDVTVLDQNGTEIGYVRGNEVESLSEDLLIIKDGDFKYVYSKVDEPIQILLSGYDFGTLDYTIEEYRDGAPIGRLNFFDIGLHEGKELSLDVDVSSLEQEKDNFFIYSDEETLSPDEFLGPEDANSVAITTNIEGNGIVSQGGMYTRGDAVTLFAYENQEDTFIGWFKDDEIVSGNPIYEFSAVESISLTALFAKLDYGMIDIDVTEMIGGEVEGAGSYFENDTVVLKATPDEGYIFIGWYEDSKRVSSSNEYSFVAATKRNIEARFISDDYVKGDVNGSGTITLADVMLVYQHYRGKALLTDGYLISSDVNESGSITLADVMLVYQYYRGKIDSFKN